MSGMTPSPLTNEQWQDRVAELGDGQFECLSIYTHNQSPVLMRHIPCGSEWEKAPNDWRRYPICPTCMGGSEYVRQGIALTHEQAQSRIDDIHGEGEYAMMSDYVNNREKVLVKHNSCGHSWLVSIGNLASQTVPSRCPKCSRKWTKETFQQRVSESFEGDEYSVVGEYLGSNVPTEMMHLSCGNIWRVSPNNFLNSNTRCPACSTAHNSRLARAVNRYLRQEMQLLGIEHTVIREHIFREETAPVSILGRPLRFDFWVEAIRLIIEADGELHDRAWNDRNGPAQLERAKQNDRIKDEWARANEITLVRIRHDDSDWSLAVRSAVLLASDRRI